MRLLIPGTSSILYQFDLPDRYKQWDRVELTKGEARALNRLLIERYVQGLTARLKALETWAPDHVLELTDIAAFGLEVQAFASKYEFPESARSDDRLGDIEREAAGLASILGGVASDFMEEARKRIIAKRSVAMQALDHL